MFELSCCTNPATGGGVGGGGHICLAFPPKPEAAAAAAAAATATANLADDGGSLIQLDVTPPTPQVWFLDKSYDWHFLAPNFTTYFRMMLVHLGLPQWHTLFTSFGPTPWAKVIIKNKQL